MHLDIHQHHAPGLVDVVQVLLYLGLVWRLSGGGDGCLALVPGNALIGGGEQLTRQPEAPRWQ